MKRLSVIVTTIVSLVILLALAASVGADYNGWFLTIHHESQGPGDRSWTRCVPYTDWEQHRGHKGDRNGGECDPRLPEPPGQPVSGFELPPIEPPGCLLDVQAYAVVDDLPSGVAYLAIAYSSKTPEMITQVDEGEVAGFYVVSNGGVESIQPKGHQAPFLALATAGSVIVDGSAYIRNCSGSVFVNMYDAAGNFLGHPALRWDGGIAKGFHAENSDLEGEISALALGVMPK